MQLQAPAFAGRDTSRQALQQTLKDHFVQMVGPVSPLEYEGVDHYTSNSHPVNGLLRIAGQSPFAPTGDAQANYEGYREAFPGRCERIVEALEGLMRRARLPFDATVYRGIKSGIRVRDLDRGQVLADPGYLSTAPFYDTAEQGFTRWERPKDGTGSFIFQIGVPQGTPCVNPDSVLTHRWLEELMFPRQSALVIDGVETRTPNRIPLVKATLVRAEANPGKVSLPPAAPAFGRHFSGRNFLA